MKQPTEIHNSLDNSSFLMQTFPIIAYNVKEDVGI